MTTALSKFFAASALLIAMGAAAFAQDAPAPKVTVAAAYTAEVTDQEIFIGKGEAINKVDIVARVSGFVDEVLVGDGDLVKKGDLLFKVEDDTYAATLAARQADLVQSKANLDLSEVELKRKSELFERQVGTEADRDVAYANNQVAIAQVKISEAAIRMAQLDVDYTQVHAPFDGRVGRVAVSVGELVGPTSSPLVNVVSIAPIYVEFSLTERQFITVLEGSDIAPGDLANAPHAPDVYVILPNGHELGETGRVVFVDNRIDPATGTVTVRAQFPNTEGYIIDGSFLNVRIQATEPTEALLIPQSALQRDQRGDFVLVVGQQQTVEQRYITVGRQVDTALIVEDGLREGEAVIVEGLQRVRPGVPVDSVLAGTPVQE